MKWQGVHAIPAASGSVILAAALLLMKSALSGNFVQAPRKRSATPVHYTKGFGGIGFDIPMGSNGKTPPSAPHIWAPGPDFNGQWINATVEDMLKPWIDGAMVNKSFVDFVDEWIPPIDHLHDSSSRYKGRRDYRRACACWQAVDIVNMTAVPRKRHGPGRCGYNQLRSGRYLSLVKETLKWMRNSGLRAGDSTIVLGAGQDEPCISAKHLRNKSAVPLPFFVSQQGNWFEYQDIVFPTVARRSFVGYGWYNQLVDQAKRVKQCCPWDKRNSSAAVWRGSPGGHRNELAHLSNIDPQCVDAAIVRNSADKLSFEKFQFVLNIGNNGFADRMKYLLTNANVVLHLDNDFYEWYYPALRHGVHYIRVETGEDGAVLKDKLCPWTRWLVAQSNEARHFASAVSQNALTFARHVITWETRTRYIAQILVRWGELWRTAS